MKVHGFVCFLLTLTFVNHSYGLNASELAGVNEVDRQLVLQLTEELKEANDGKFDFEIKKIGGNVKRVGEERGIDRFQSSTSNKYTYEYASYRNSLLIDKENKVIGVNIKNNNLRDMSTINKFKHLKYLFIDSHKENMTNVLLGDNLTSLKELTIRDSGVEKINIKTTLSNLTYLNFEHNKISDLSFLNKTPSLINILGRRNNIRSLEPISEMSKLQFLNMGHNIISALGSLKNNSNLVEVYLQNNKIESVNSLADKGKIEILKLDFNPLKSVAGISSSRLVELFLYKTAISSLEKLPSSTSLKKLVVVSTNISSLKGIERNPNITILNFSDTDVKDISLVKNLTKLKVLMGGSANVENIDVVTCLKNIEKIGFSNNSIKAIPPLDGLPRLQKIFLTGTQISSIDPFRNVPELYSLVLFDSPLKIQGGFDGFQNIEMTAPDNETNRRAVSRHKEYLKKNRVYVYFK